MARSGRMGLCGRLEAQISSLYDYIATSGRAMGGAASATETVVHCGDQQLVRLLQRRGGGFGWRSGRRPPRALLCGRLSSVEK